MKTLVASVHAEWRPRIAMEALRLGSDIHTVSNGFEAIELFRKHRYDVVVMDGSFLDMSAVELLLNLSEIAHNDPVILVREPAAERRNKIWTYCNAYLAGPYPTILAAMEPAAREAKRRRCGASEPISIRRTRPT